jgi:hypothetical protein
MKKPPRNDQPATVADPSHFRDCAVAFLAVLFVGFVFYRTSSNPFRDDLNIPKWKLRGLDFRAYHVFATDLLEGESPYRHDTEAGPNPYPPLYTIFVAPFAMFGEDTAYDVWVTLSIVAYLAAIWLATRFGDVPVSWMVLAGAAYVLSQTYPVPFVWERGTPEFFILLSMAGGLLLLTRGQYIAAIVLLTIATHFKLYPLVLGSFVLLRGGWKWAAIFTGVVIAAFFILGVGVFREFLNVILYTVREPERWVWPGNHTLKAFSMWCELKGFISHETAGLLVMAVGGALILIFCWMLWSVYRRGRGQGKFSAAEASLLGMAFCLMTLLPTFSHDYKLAQQFFPLLILMVNADAAALAARSRAVRILMIVTAGMAGSLFLPRFGEVPRTPQLLLTFALYTALTELFLRGRPAAVSTTPVRGFQVQPTGGTA